MSAQTLTSSERARLDVKIREAEQSSRAEISVYVGDVEGSTRDFATSLHNTLVLPARSVLIMVDTERRALEIVTGGQVRARLADDKVAVIAAEMTAAFGAGDLAGGLAAGIERIGKEAAA